MTQDESVKNPNQDFDGLIKDSEQIRSQMLELLKDIKNSYENSKKVNKLVKQDIERMVEGYTKAAEDAHSELGNFKKNMKLVVEMAKTERAYKYLIKYVEDFDTESRQISNNPEFAPILAVNLCRFSNEEVLAFAKRAIDIMNQAVDHCDRFAELCAKTIDDLKEQESVEAETYNKTKEALSSLYSVTEGIKETLAETDKEVYGQYYVSLGTALPALVNGCMTIYFGTSHIPELLQQLQKK